ncbi:hypothetical protein ROZALSC1DRAFT_29644 [Rozella allomycis CSF55]|uniref:SLC26A/SulP transporter domain-containing protein n=1 Tax=Rozella allomycis (strain CSF55) TaxID=988480 RepID=A0A4P9YI28_ROZAC|nr:hypothetical protein ROZALSC1DRAFT_29644 [Rozella allomycis CSF55]
MAILWFIHQIQLWSWRKNYKFKDFNRDFICGLSLTVILIPQSMAYATLAGLPPVYGLYSSVVPSIVYSLLATSRHISFGPFALISMLVNEAVKNIQGDKIDNAMSLTLFVGLIQIIGSFLGLGRLSVVFTAPSSSGIPYESKSSPFSLIKQCIHILVSINQLKAEIFAMSLTSLIFLEVMKVLNKRWKERLIIPIPDVLIIIIVSTFTLSFTNFNFPIIGHIPSGIFSFRYPILSNFGSLTFNAIIISILSFSLSISVAMKFASDKNYAVSSNQELFSYGVSNIIGSFFSSYASCASLSRSSILVESGAVSPMASIISALAVSIVLVYFSFMFEKVPMYTLAVIVISALRPMLSQIFLIKAYFHSSKIDFVIWIVTFLTTITIDVIIGLAVGICMSSISMLYFKLSRKNYEVGVVMMDGVYKYGKLYEFIPLWAQRFKRVNGVRLYMVESEEIPLIQKESENENVLYLLESEKGNIENYDEERNLIRVSKGADNFLLTQVIGRKMQNYGSHNTTK